MERFVKVLDEGVSTEAIREGFPLTLEGLDGWLKQKNVLPADASMLSFSDVDTWHRAGAETYQASAEVEWIHVGITYKTKVLLKALVTLFGDLALQVWTRRRRFLAESGVPVSRWFSWGSALIIEPYYPNDYKATSDRRQLAGIAEKLDLSGFAPRHFLSDIRCDDSGTPFYVDFGEDLGEPGVSKAAVAMAQYRTEFGDPRERH